MSKRNFILPLFLIFAAVIFIWGEQLKSVFLPILAALLLTYIANPFVSFFSRRMPKIVAAILFYIIIAALCILLISFIMPTFLSALEKFIAFLPALGERLSEKIPMVSCSSLSQYLKGKAEDISAFLKNAFSFITSASFAVVLSCFFLTDTSFLKKGLSSIFPDKILEKFLPVVREIDSVFKGYFRSQVVVALFLSALTFIFLILLRIKHAFILSLIYGIFCFIPFFGPFIGGVPIVIISYITSPITALLSLISVLLTQFIENTFLSPKIKADSVDISPASAFIAVYLGASFLGLFGVLFGIPIFASIKIILRRLLSVIS